MISTHTHIYIYIYNVTYWVKKNNMNYISIYLIVDAWLLVEIFIVENYASSWWVITVSIFIYNTKY